MTESGQRPIRDTLTDGEGADYFTFYKAAVSPGRVRHVRVLTRRPELLRGEPR